MNNEIQAMDIVDNLKSQIAELSYQVAYREGVIKAQERQLEELQNTIQKLAQIKTSAVDETENHMED